MQNAASSRAGFWVAALIVIGLLIYGFVRLISSTSLTNITSLRAGDHTIGDTSKKVVLIEYSDFQCPACASYHPLVKQLTQELGNQFVFAYRHFPLTGHPNADEAARAAEAAAKQGKFWEMHDLLFERQSFWGSEADPEAKFLTYAELLNLNTTTFVADYRSDALKTIVEQSVADGTSIRVDRTPTFFLNGRRLINLPEDYAGFKKLIEDEAKKQQ